MSVTNGARALAAPIDGERPVTVSKASQETGYSRTVIYDRVRRGILPARLPFGCVRGLHVYVSQLINVMEGVDDA